MPTPPLDFTHEVRPDVLILRLRGSAGFEQTGVLQDCLRTAQSHSRPVVVLDLSGLEYIASAGLGALISLHQSITQRQGQLRVAGLSGMVRSAFETTGLASTFRLYPDLDSALGGPPGLHPTP